HALRAQRAIDRILNFRSRKQVGSIARAVFRLFPVEQIGRQNDEAIEFLARDSCVQIVANLIERAAIGADLFDDETRLRFSVARCVWIVESRRGRLRRFARVIVDQLLGHPRVHLAGLIDDADSRRSASFNSKHHRWHNRKADQQKRPQNRRNHEKFRAHPLDVFAFDNGEEFFHPAFFTSSIKMSCKEASTSSNFVTTAPVSTSRFNNTCGSAPATSNTSNSSPTCRILATTSGSLSSASLPSNRSATALRAR